MRLYEEIHRPVVIVGGLHGDEPAGNYAADFFEGRNNVHVISNINKTGERKFFNKDLNRHFDKDESQIQENIMGQIENLNPKMVISLHEDNESKGVYVYSSEDLKETLQNILKKLGLPVVTMAENDRTSKGVITNGKQPYNGSLERALARRDIPYCTIETPVDWELAERISAMKHIVEELISYK